MDKYAPSAAAAAEDGDAEAASQVPCQSVTDDKLCRRL